MIHAFIKKGCFQDSVSLMIISRKLSESENVDDVSVMMGTPANKALLDTTGFWHDDLITPRRTIFAWQFVAKRRMRGSRRRLCSSLKRR